MTRGSGQCGWSQTAARPTPPILELCWHKCGRIVHKGNHNSKIGGRGAAGSAPEGSAGTTRSAERGVDVLRRGLHAVRGRGHMGLLRHHGGIDRMIV